MALSRILWFALAVGASILLTTHYLNTRALAQSSNARSTTAGNPITGEGLPNPASIVTRNWGQLPAGRKWGTTAGIDIDPTDGNVWGYERCGSGTAGGGPVDCDNTPLDPIFKFDRRTGAVLANFGKRVMVTPHGLPWTGRATCGSPISRETRTAQKAIRCTSSARRVRS